MQSVAMMQSVALGESSCNVESVDDFVLVQQPAGSFDLIEEVDDGGCDDDSYDYCEDVYSIVSNEGEQSASIYSEDVEDISVKLEPQVVLTVPSVLLKDLDDAHEAAKLVQIPDSEQRSDDSTVTFARSMTKDNLADVDSREEVASVDNEGAGTEEEDGFEEAKEQEDDDLLSSDGKMSRASNKKRRKKLKLMKKAIAAANAAQAMSERACSTSRSSDCQVTSKLKKKSKKKSRATGVTGGRNKRVANIAVACATETLSAYRKELLSKGKQVC